MPRFLIEVEQEDGWSRWVPPRPGIYRMGCCDCGLVHDMDFQVVRVLRKTGSDTFEHGNPLSPDKYRVLFRARRNKRSTTLLRKRDNESMKNKTETKQTRAINKAAETVSRALLKFAEVCEKNGSPLKTLTYHWKPPTGESSKMSVRYKRTE